MIITDLFTDEWLLSDRQAFRLADAVIINRVPDRNIDP